MVLALPRGGVPVAAEVARTLAGPLDVFVARKVGAPGREEYGIGAIAEGDVIVADEHALETLGVSADEFTALAATQQVELHRRVELYRGGRDLIDVRGRDVVLVDDGLATGVTAEAALLGLRRRGPRRLLVAVPAGAADTAVRLRRIADEVECVVEAADFTAVGAWYDDFRQTSDEEVRRLLRAAAGTPTDDR